MPEESAPFGAKQKGRIERPVRTLEDQVRTMLDRIETNIGKPIPNDCPALASAHVGIVLQEVGSQATVDAASAVLQVEIDQLPAAIAIARRSRRLVWTNLFLALAINVAVIALAATVGLPLWLSVLSDSGGLLVVLANSLWPLTWCVGAPAPRPRGGSLSL